MAPVVMTKQSEAWLHDRSNDARSTLMHWTVEDPDPPPDDAPEGAPDDVPDPPPDDVPEGPPDDPLVPPLLGPPEETPDDMPDPPELPEDPLDDPPPVFSPVVLPPHAAKSEPTRATARSALGIGEAMGPQAPYSSRAREQTAESPMFCARACARTVHVAAGVSRAPSSEHGVRSTGTWHGDEDDNDNDNDPIRPRSRPRARPRAR
jgi:hypothetical protein